MKNEYERRTAASASSGVFRQPPNQSACSSVGMVPGSGTYITTTFSSFSLRQG
jgi:hypothetical protein